MNLWSFILSSWHFTSSWKKLEISRPEPVIFYLDVKLDFCDQTASCCFPLFSASHFFCMGYKRFRFPVFQECFNPSSVVVGMFVRRSRCLRKIADHPEERDIFTYKSYFPFSLLYLPAVLHSSPFLPNFLPFVPFFPFLWVFWYLGVFQIIGEWGWQQVIRLLIHTCFFKIKRYDNVLWATCPHVLLPPSSLFKLISPCFSLVALSKL